jgi:hypothetical protein
MEVFWMDGGFLDGWRFSGWMEVFWMDGGFREGWRFSGGMEVFGRDGRVREGREGQWPGSSRTRMTQPALNGPPCPSLLDYFRIAAGLRA